MHKIFKTSRNMYNIGKIFGIKSNSWVVFIVEDQFVLLVLLPGPVGPLPPVPLPPQGPPLPLLVPLLLLPVPPPPVPPPPVPISPGPLGPVPVPGGGSGPPLLPVGDDALLSCPLRRGRSGVATGR